MGYIDERIQPDEQVLTGARVSPAVLWTPFFIFLLFLGTLIASLELAASYNEYKATLGAVLFCLAGIMLLAVLLALAAAVGRFFTTALAVTRRRVLGRVGLLRRRAIDLPLERIERVEVQQNLFGRLTRSGALVITEAGGGRLRIGGLTDPAGLAEEIRRLLDRRAV